MSSFIAPSPLPPNHPGLRSRHIKNHKIPLSVLQAEQTGEKETHQDRGGGEEGERKQTKLEAASYRISSDWRSWW